jgi:hypothetical protein
MNFNTNQTRHLYVAKVDKTGSTLSDNLDIQVAQAATGEFYFTYKNADGLITRSDTIDPKKVLSVKLTAAADMDTKLTMYTVAVDTSKVTLANLVGKTLDCIVTAHQVFDYDYANSVSVVASVTGNATNTASAAAFHKDLAIAIAKAMPKLTNFPLFKVFSNGSEVTSSTAASDVTGASGGVVLVEAAQKYVRGKLNGEPCPLSVAFRYADGNVDDIDWGTATPATSNISGNTIVTGTRKVADLEWFALGERGDVYRGAMWPNDFETTYAVDLSKTYDILTIEYYWAGNAENVQKSPRMIQVACEIANSESAASSLKETIDGYISGE